MDAAPLILVVGMHRSGTSLLSGLLHGLGFSSSGALIAADHNNPEGYFERADVTAIQERLLTDLGRWWPTATALLPLPPSWLIEPCTEHAHQALVQLLQAEPAQVPIALKDPRSSRLLPFWRRIACELHRPLRLILAVRDPEEVITSLVKRDGPVTGMTVERAADLWLQHNEEVLIHSVGLPLLLVDYSRWFEPTAAADQLQSIARFCDLSTLPSDQQAALLQHIRPEHRRSIPEQPLAPAACTAFYRHLQQGERTPLPPATPGPENRPHTSLHRDLQQHPWGAIALQSSGGQERQARQLLQRWVVEGLGAERGGPVLLQGWFDAGFYIAANSDLLAGLSPEDGPGLLRHYLLHGWMEGRRPHPCFDPGHYLQQLLQRGIPLPAEQSPLEHFLKVGRHIGIVPSSLVSSATDLAVPPDWRELHPWAGAALALADHNRHSAAVLLQHWILQGGPPDAVIRLAASDTGHNLRWPATMAMEQRNTTAELDLRIWPHAQPSWEAIGWLASLEEPTGLIQLCLSSPDTDTVTRWLQQQSGGNVEIVETDPLRHGLWQRFRLCSRLISCPDAQQLERWLPAEPWLARAEQWLGLPHPDGLSHHRWLCFGPGGPFWDEQSNLDLAYVPGLNDLHLSDLDQARALACWLWHCHRRGLQLIEFRTSPREPTPRWLPIITINPFGLDQQGLIELLEEQHSSEAAHADLPTPQPHRTIAFCHNSAEQAEVAVVVSLHNYAEQILEALESVRMQTLNRLELIVVDDASSDDGASRVQAWMEREHQRFSRCLLVQHTTNGGLAAARNTAFQLASSAWCFVLDADNSLRPACLEHCWRLARLGSKALAVVHPLIQRRDPNGLSDGLISGRSWQRESLISGNHIDAMALVKREAWSQVDGFTHIPHGWEDYDFWCKLIGAGFHGVLCPEVLATYRIHPQSMVHQSSHRHTHRLSRILQQRHPWLQLPLAGSEL
jgi:GT2 family glycosyltransferase